MIKIEKIDIGGLDATIRGMRNPMNSWDKSDSYYEVDKPGYYAVGENDMKLMKALVKGGGDERKFLRMIHVAMDITAPLYWWKEFDTYKVGTTANSCSTMHKIQAKEFTLDDFSHEHLATVGYPVHCYGRDTTEWYIDVLSNVIRALNAARKEYLKTKDKMYWWQMIQLLPSSYNQKRTVDLNYEVLLRIYPKRRNHKLDEWHTFCDLIETMPFMNEFIEAAYGKELHD